MSNEALKEHINKLNNLCKLAKTKDDIEGISSEVELYSKSGDYSLKQPVVLTVQILSVIAIIITLVMSIYWGVKHESLPIIGWGGAFFLVVFRAIFLFRQSGIDGVGSEAYFKSVAIHNNLTEEYGLDGNKMWSDLRDEFPFFNVGDEDQEISRLYKGKADDGTGFSLFKFKYVEVKEEEEEDSDGNKTTKTTRTTLYKYGCLVELTALNGITINSGRYREKWNSASKSFNNKFRVRCSDPIKAAKFFTPSVVLRFDDEFSVLNELDILENSKACVGLHKSVFPTNLKTPDINKTDVFISHMRNPKDLPALQKTKELIEYINERTKNNLKKVS